MHDFCTVCRPTGMQTYIGTGVLLLIGCEIELLKEHELSTALGIAAFSLAVNLYYRFVTGQSSHRTPVSDNRDFGWVL
jgi:hypothetical protein